MAPSTTDSDSVGQRAGFVRLQICLGNICPGVANKQIHRRQKIGGLDSYSTEQKDDPITSPKRPPAIRKSGNACTVCNACTLIFP
jgi:hypothetical protein